MPFAAVGTAIAGAAAGSIVSSALAPSGNSSSGGSTAAAAAADPFASQRGQYQTMLSNLINDPSSVTQTPGYQFNYQQGLNSLTGSEAAGGYLNSGNRMTAAEQYGQNYATSQYNSQASLLSQLAGGNIGSPSTAGTILQGQNTANQTAAATLGNQVGSAVTAGVNSAFSPSAYSSTSNPFATDTSGMSAGANTYNFSSGVSDPSYGVSY